MFSDAQNFVTAILRKFQLPRPRKTKIYDVFSKDGFIISNFPKSRSVPYKGAQQGFFGTRDLPLFEMEYREIGFSNCGKRD